MKVYLICDESGAKARATIGERYPGEVGVFAGYIVPENQFDSVNSECKKIESSYFGEGKPHLRSNDLTDTEKESLRREVFNFIDVNKISCVYEAIHVRGFNAFFRLQYELYEKAKKLRTAAVKLNSDRIDPESLHTALFQGLFCRGIGVVSDKYGPGVSNLEILVDEVNKKELREFCATALEIGDLSPKTKKVSGWDPVKNKVVNRSIVYSIGPESFLTDLKSLPQYRISVGDKHLIIPADVIANSIHHYFKSRHLDQVGQPLLQKATIRDHPLSKYFCGLSTGESEYGPDSDNIYPYRAK